MTNSRRKGKEGELELAKILRAYGYEARRGQQYSGANGDADVVGLPGVHIEAKRYKTITDGDLDHFMEQAVRDARPGEYPAVFYRADRQRWRVCMRVDHLAMMYWKGKALGLPGVALPVNATMALDTFMMIYRNWKEAKE